MPRTGTVVVVLLLVGVCLGFPSNGLIVKFKDGTSKRSTHARYGGQHESTLDIISADVVNFASPELAEAALKKYQQDPEIEYAEPDHPTHASAVNDPQFTNVWSLGPNFFDIERVWADHGVDGTGVIVAVVDSGVQYDHEDLAGQVLVSEGYDFVNNDNDAYDDNGHGTHCAGTIAAARNNGVGISGIAPGAKILPVKVLNAKGGGKYSLTIQGIQHSVSKRSKVINISLGGNSYSQALADAVQAAANSGAFLSCSMGNDGERGSPTNYPAALPGCNGIANYQFDNQIAPSSSRGNHCKVAAPGSSILSTVPIQVTGNNYLYYTGTSMAAPHVAGVVALMLQKAPYLTPQQITQILISTATDRGAPGFDVEFGYGAVNLYGSLNAIAPATTGVQTTGIQTTGVQTTGIQTTGVQTTGVQTTGIQTTGTPYGPPLIPTDVIIYRDGLHAPFRAFSTSAWIDFYSPVRLYGQYSLGLSPLLEHDHFLISCDSNCFNPTYYESISFNFAGGTFYFYATDAAFQPLGAVHVVYEQPGFWASRRFSLSDLAGNVAPTYLIFYASRGNVAYIENLVMNARVVPLAGAVYQKPLDATEKSSNPSQTASLSPWQFSVTGSEIFRISSTYDYVPGDQFYSYEAELTVGDVVHKIPLESLSAGQLSGATPSFGATGSFSMKILRNGEQLFPDALPVTTYDCSAHSDCDICVTVGPQCLWCQESCSDIRGSSCPFEEQIKPCESAVLSESSAAGVVLSIFVVVLAASLPFF